MNQELTIEIEGQIAGGAYCEITALSGRILFSQEMSMTSSSFAEYFADVSSYNKGTYLVKVSTDKGIYTKKFIKN